MGEPERVLPAAEGPPCHAEKRRACGANPATSNGFLDSANTFAPGTSLDTIAANTGGAGGAATSFLPGSAEAQQAASMFSADGIAPAATNLGVSIAASAPTAAAATGAAAATTAAASASSMPAWLMAIADLFADGGAVPGYAEGGDVSGMTNMLMRREAGETFHPSGLLNSAGPGRTDTINTNVPAGAYVVPADVTSGLGEGNSLAGSAVIDRMFDTGPRGVKMPQIRHGRGAPAEAAPRPISPESEPAGVDTSFINSAGAYAKGGQVPEKAPVVLAGGEHVIPPEAIIKKFGSLKRGHKILDHWIVMERERIAKEMLKLAPPVGSRVKKDKK